MATDDGASGNDIYTGTADDDTIRGFEGNDAGWGEVTVTHSPGRSPRNGLA